MHQSSGGGSALPIKGTVLARFGYIVLYFWCELIQ